MKSKPHQKRQKSDLFVEKFGDKYDNDQNYRKVKDYCHYTGEQRDAEYSICNLEYGIPIQITVLFHNGSNYDYHFVIKKLVEEFEGQFPCSREKPFQFQQKKKLKELVKIQSKLPKLTNFTN